MPAYTFADDEYVVLKAQEVRLDGGSPLSKMGRGSELMLTNRAVVLVQKGLTGKVKGYDVYPLANLRVVDGKPQVRLDSSAFMEEKLELSMKDGMVSFVFGSLDAKKEVRAWVDAIYQQLVGAEAPQDALGKGKVEEFLDEEHLADSFGKLFGTFQNALEHRRFEGAREVAGRCPSCDASIKGKPGETVTCPFCGTYVTL